MTGFVRVTVLLYTSECIIEHWQLNPLNPETLNGSCEKTKLCTEVHNPVLWLELHIAKTVHAWMNGHEHNTLRDTFFHLNTHVVTEQRKRTDKNGIKCDKIVTYMAWSELKRRQQLYPTGGNHAVWSSLRRLILVCYFQSIPHGRATLQTTRRASLSPLNTKLTQPPTLFCVCNNPGLATSLFVSRGRQG